MLSTSDALANDSSSFRIDTDIYMDLTKPPVMNALTLFSDGVAYDFENTDLAKVTVIDPKRQRIVLIDRARKIKTTLSTSQLQVMVSSARVQADAKLSSATRSELVSNNGEPFVIVANDSIEYRATLQKPESVDAPRQFAEFADWSARLNAVYPPRMPPFLRLDLNRLVSEQGMLPKEIIRTTRQRGREVSITCKVLPINRLSRDDEAKIAKVGVMLAEFREATPEEYWNEVPAVKTAADSGTTKR